MRIVSVSLKFCSSLFLVGGLSACSLLIPENPSAPRYNKVEGEMRKPELNRGMPAGSVAAPVTPVAMQSIPDLPPVDPAVQARAAQEMAALDATGRSMPVENRSLINSGVAPDLSSVPPRPVMGGDASAEARLAKTKAELEQDRTQALASKEQLIKDAKSESSGLAPMPAPVSPPALPVPEVKPIAKAPLSPEPVSTVPPPQPIAVTPIAPPENTGYIANVPSFAPPPPLNPGAMPAPAPVPVPVAVAPAPAPMPAPTYSAPAAAPAPAIAVAPLPAPLPSGKEPIMLRPPAGMMATVPEPMPMPAPTTPNNMAPASSGGFDPMADASSARAGSLYQATGYLPTSRYAERR